MAYATETEKRMVACVSACIGVLEDMIRIDFPKLHDVMPRIKACKTHLVKVLNTATEGIDSDQMQGVVRWIKNSEIMVMPKSDVRVQKELAIVDGPDLEFIVKNSLSDCALCMHGPAEVKQCQLRKALLRCGVMPKPDSRGHCPFQP